MMFTAATLTRDQTRNAVLTQLQNYASPNFNNTPYAVVYNPTTGRARPGRSGMNRSVLITAIMGEMFETYS